MKKLLITAALAFTVSGVLLPGSIEAARRRTPSPATKTYQVTGPVLEVTDDAVVVQKGKEKWEIARTADSKVTGELKVGAKVTIEYQMVAKTVEVKADKK